METGVSTRAPGRVPHPEGHEPHEVFDPDAELLGYERSPLDVLRVVLLGAAALMIAVLMRFLRSGYDGVEEDLTRVLEVPVTWLRVSVDVLLVMGVLTATVVVFVVPLATRRYRLFGYVITANVLAAAAIAGIGTWVGGLDAERLGINVRLDDSARSLGGDVGGAAQMVAAFVVVAPFVSRRWRKAGGWLVGSVLVLKIVVASGGESTNALLVLTVGGAVGSAVLLAFGRPTTRPRMSAVLQALRNSSVPVTSIAPAGVEARSSLPYVASGEDGTAVFAKVLGSDQRAADLLFRVYRMLRLKNVGDERPFSSLRRTVEHEALVALRARDVDVDTPRLRCVAPVGDDSFLLAYDLVDGVSLDQVDPDRIDDAVLDQIWQQVALLRRYRIAHRDLRLANLLLDTNGKVWIIDFGFAEVAAADVLLRSDVAQLLASLTVLVGPQRAVSSSVAVLGTEAVGASLGRLQPTALSASTQSALKGRKGVLAELRDDVAEQCGIDEPELEPVARFTGKQLFTLVMLVAVVYFLLPQVADLPGIVGEIGDADWVWAIPMLLASAMTFVGAAVALGGSVPDPIAAGPTVAAQMATSFASKLAPAGLGGMALNVRYLQRSGVDSAVATSGVGLNVVAGLVVHVMLLGVFVVWAGRQAFGGISLPSPRAFLIGAAVALVIALVALAVPATRRLLTGTLAPIVKRSLDGLWVVLTNPVKLVLLLGGSATVTLAYTGAFYFAGEAFGLDLRFATIGAVYLLGSAVATAAPTPGGLGAAEAALVGGLIAVGVSDAAAVPAVFLFRLATFWLPVVPGWVAFSWLRRTDRL